MGSWIHPDHIEYLLRRCQTRVRLYGGTSKIQSRGFVEIPVGTKGIARQRITDGETGVQYFLCTFRVGPQKLWTRCALDMIDLA